jgi:hypothetical protein
VEQISFVERKENQPQKQPHQKLGKAIVLKNRFRNFCHAWFLSRLSSSSSSDDARFGGALRGKTVEARRRLNESDAKSKFILSH